MRSTTSFCSMKCWSSTSGANSARWNSSGLEMLYGKLPTMRSFWPAGTGIFAKSNFSASPEWIVSLAGLNVFSRRTIRSRSSSTTCICFKWRSNCSVMAPRPGPISTMASSACGAMAAVMSSRTKRSCRKFWPKRLRATCFICCFSINALRRGVTERSGTGTRAQHVERRVQGLLHAVAIGQAQSLCSEVERRAVIDRGAYQRQAQGDIDAAPEGGVFQYGQALVMVHGQHAIGIGQVFLLEQGIGRIRSARIDAARLGCGYRWGNYVDFFAPQITTFARMRVEAGDQDARCGNAELLLQISVDDVQRHSQAVQGDGGRHIFQ